MNPIEDLSVLALAVAICSLVYTLVTMRALLVRHNTLEAQLETRLNQLPSAQEFIDLRVKLAGMDARQDSVLAEVHGTRSAVRRVEDFLLKGKSNE